MSGLQSWRDAREAELRENAKHGAVWNRARIEKDLASLEIARQNDAVTTIDTMIRETSRTTIRDNATVFLLHAAALLALAAGGSEDLDHATRHFAGAGSALRRAGIGPAGSRLSALHAKLRAALGAVSERAGRPWLAAWSQALAGQAPTNSDLAARMLDERGAETLLRQTLEAMLDSTGDDRANRTLFRARALRLCGRGDEAEALLAGLDTTDARWERLAAVAMRTTDLSGLAMLQRNQPEARTPRRELVYALWAHAVPSRAFRAEASPIRAIMRRAGASFESSVKSAAKTVERCFDTSVAIQARIRLAEELVQRADDIGDPELQLLVLGALARWLLSAKQRALASIAFARYEVTCIGLSQGQTRDLFTLTQTAAARAATPAGESTQRSKQLRSLGLAIARIGTKYLVSGSNRSATIAEGAALLAQHAALLKGPLMKIGQLLSFYGIALPPEATASLATLQDDARPMCEAREVRAILRAELGRDPNEVFSSFDGTAFASGSIGQVHEARLRETGDRVIVKVLYPGMLDIIDKDFRALALIRPLATIAFPHWEWARIFDELHAQMKDECDFSREASEQAWFREHFADDPDIVIPRVRTEHCRSRVLVTDFFDGMSFATFAEQGSEPARRRASRAICRYVIRSSVLARRFNTDLQPGNLLFDDDGRVCFIDFGNVKRWDGELGVAFRELLSGFVYQDVELTRAGLRKFGLYRDELTEAEVAQWLRLTSDFLMRAVSFDKPSRIEKAQIIREITSMFPEGPVPGRKVAIPPQYAYGFRIYWGMFAVISDLGVEDNWHRIARDVLESQLPS